jgi:hypothetical protein
MCWHLELRLWVFICRSVAEHLNTNKTDSGTQRKDQLFSATITFIPSHDVIPTSRPMRCPHITVPNNQTAPKHSLPSTHLKALKAPPIPTAWPASSSCSLPPPPQGTQKYRIGWVSQPVLDVLKNKKLGRLTGNRNMTLGVATRRPATTDSDVAAPKLSGNCAKNKVQALYFGKPTWEVGTKHLMLKILGVFLRLSTKVIEYRVQLEHDRSTPHHIWHAVAFNCVQCAQMRATCGVRAQCAAWWLWLKLLRNSCLVLVTKKTNKEVTSVECNLHFVKTTNCCMIRRF